MCEQGQQKVVATKNCGDAPANHRAKSQSVAAQGIADMEKINECLENDKTAIATELFKRLTVLNKTDIIHLISDALSKLVSEQ